MLFTFAAFASVAMAQVSVDDIAGKYRLVPDCEPSYYIEDHGFDPECIVIVDKVDDKSFAIDNFYYDTQNYDGDHVQITGNFTDAGEWSSYPTVQSIRFEWDNTDMYLYNPGGETDDTQWFFFASNSMRFVPTKDADGKNYLSLWPNNKILLSYYSESNGSYDNPALEFVNMGAWQEGKEGSMKLERLPLYTTVSKRALSDTYTIKGIDQNGNAVKFAVEIASEGGESYTMTGFAGSQQPITFTWDDTDAGMRAQYVELYDEEGNLTFAFEGYNPNLNIYISFTEDGALAFDQAIYFYEGETELQLFDLVATKGVDLEGDVATGYFADGDTYEDLGLDPVPVPYTMTEGEIVLRNFAETGYDIHLDLNVEPYVYGGYSYYYPNFSGEGCTNDGIYFMLGDADSYQYGPETIANGLYMAYSWYEPTYNWLELCYYSDNYHKWNYLDIYFDEPWGIDGLNHVVAEPKQTQTFDLMGRRSTRTAGLMISNGKIIFRK